MREGQHIYDYDNGHILGLSCGHSFGREAEIKGQVSGAAPFVGGHDSDGYTKATLGLRDLIIGSGSIVPEPVKGMFSDLDHSLPSFASAAKLVKKVDLDASKVDVDVRVHKRVDVPDSPSYIKSHADLYNHFDPYDTAMNGGAHSRWAKQYLNKDIKEIEKGIKSFDKQIESHIEKINNPRKYIPDWNNLPLRHQQDLITNKWPGDIARQQKQRSILEGILRSRNGA